MTKVNYLFIDVCRRKSQICGRYENFQLSNRV